VLVPGFGSAGCLLARAGRAVPPGMPGCAPAPTTPGCASCLVAGIDGAALLRYVFSAYASQSKVSVPLAQMVSARSSKAMRSRWALGTSVAMS